MAAGQKAPGGARHCHRGKALIFQLKVFTHNAIVMKNPRLVWVVLLGAAVAPAAAQTLPATPKRPVVDTYFGQKVTDNYRWLEDLKSPETQAWFKA